jgi:O-antigen/teichoic acid export membrane protein
MGGKVFHNILSRGLLTIFNLLLPFAVLPYIYRVISPEYIGKIEYAATIYAYFAIFGTLGIYNYGLREISANRDDHNNAARDFVCLFKIGAASNLFVFIVFIVIIHTVIHDIDIKNILFIYSIQLLAQIFHVEFVNEAYEKYRFITIKTIAVRMAGFVSIFLFVKGGEDYLLYAVIMSASTLVNYAASFLFANHHLSISASDFFIRTGWKHILPKLIMVLVLNNSSILYTMLDKTMLGIFSSANDVAYYGVGQKFSEMLKLFLLIPSMVTIPRMSNYLKNNKKKYCENIHRLIDGMLLIVIPMSVGLFLFSKEVVLLFCGDQYLGALFPVRIFSLRIILMVLEAVLYNQVIFLHKKEKILIKFNFICGGLNFVLKIMFLRILTPGLAILTTALSEILFQIFCLIYISKRLNIHINYFRKNNLLYALLSLSFFIIVPLTRNFISNIYLMVLTAVTACFGIYILGLYIFKDNFIRNFKRIITA